MNRDLTLRLLRVPCGRSPARRLPTPPGRAAPTIGQVGDVGFSLVELLVAIVVVSIVGIGASQLVLGSVEVVGNADFTTTASMLATEKIEELRSYDYAADELAAGSYSEDQVDGFVQFSRQWTVEENVPRTGLKRITVTVSARWRSNGPVRTARAITYRASNAFAEAITP